MRYLLAFTFLILTSCMTPTEKGSISVDIDPGDVANGGSSNAPVVDNVTLLNDQLTLVGSHFSNLSSVTLDGNNLSVVSNDGSTLVLSASSSLNLAITTALNLVVTTAHGATAVSVTFNVVDNSITSAKIADDQILARHLSTSIAANKVPFWDGSAWSGVDLSGLNYQGGYDANTDTPDLGAIGGTTVGDYYIVSVAGSSDVDGITSWSAGDWLVWNGTTFDKIDNSVGVISFNGRTGTVTPAINDYTWNQIDKTTSDIGDIQNVDTSGAVDGSILKYNSGTWEVASDETVGAGSVTTTAIQDGTIQAVDLNAALNTTLTQVGTNQTNISSNDTDIANNASNIATNTTNISTNATNISSNDTDIANNATNIGNNTTAIGTKENTIAAGTTAQYFRGDKSWQTLNTTAVAEGTNLYYTTARAKADTVIDSTAGTQNDLAPSVDAMKNYVLSTVGTATSGITSSQWSTSGSDVYFSGGSVGVGAVTPSYEFGVQQTDSTLYVPSSGVSATPAGYITEFANTDITDGTSSLLQFSTRSGGTINRSYIGGVSSTNDRGHIVFGQRTGASAYEESMRLDDQGYLGIGTSTPNTKLDVIGTVTATAFVGDGSGLTGIISSGSSTLVNNVIAADSDANASGDIIFQTAGTTKATISNSGDMTLGSAVNSGTGVTSFSIGSTTEASVISLGENSNTNGSITWDNTNDLLSIGTSTSGASYPDTLVVKDGRVGIGTTEPSEEFEIQANAPAIELESTGGSGRRYGIQSASDGKFYIFDSTAGQNRVAIDSAGNFGLGINSPAAKLHLFGGEIKVDSTGTRLIDLNTTAVGGFVYQSFRTSDTEDWWLVGNSTTKDLSFRADPLGSPKEFLFMDYSTGNIGIGTTSPDNRLQVVAATGTNGAFNKAVTIGLAGGSQGGWLGSRTAASNQRQGLMLSSTQTLTLHGDSSGDGSGVLDVLGGGSPDITGDTSSLFRINADGNVGIGTTAPSRQLHLKSTTGRSSFSLESLDFPFVELNHLDGNNRQWHIENGREGSGILGFYAAGTGTVGTAMVIDHTNGNVGIGLTTPNEALFTKGNIAIFQSNSDTDGLIWKNPAYSKYSAGIKPVDLASNARQGLGFFTGDYGDSSTNAIERMRITRAGSVGVGITNPLGSFHVSDALDNSAQTSARADESGVKITNTNTTAGSYSKLFMASGGTADGFYFKTIYNANNDIDLDIGRVDSASGVYQTDSSRLFIENSGRVGIGTTSPGYKLDVNGDVNIAGANALRFGGTSVCTSAGCTAVSDERLKEDVTPLERSLDKILELNPVDYFYIDKDKFGESKYLGFIAQELQKDFPEVVKEDKKSGYLSVAYGHLVAPVVKAIQEFFGIYELDKKEQDRRIASLEEENAEIKSENAEIKSENAEIKSENAEIKSENAEIKSENAEIKSENAEMKKFLCTKYSDAPFCN